MLLLCQSYFSLAQNKLNATDSAAMAVPTSMRSVEAIAEHLTQNAGTAEEQIRALYIWVAHNIHYDVAALENRKGYFTTDEIVKETLAKRKGLCQHYAEVLHALAAHLGLESQVIVGYTKQNNKIDPINHAWNAVKIDGEWYNLDVTWAAGYIYKGKYVHTFRDRYFMIPPERFVKTHMPFDPIWQFSENPISHKAFVHHERDTLFSNFSYKLAIEDLKNMDELTYHEARMQRTMMAGNDHQLIREHTDFLTMKMTNIRYNLAVEKLNTGINQFNRYIQQKNRFFKNPSIPDEAITAQLATAFNNINYAETQMAALSTNDETLHAMIIQAREQMPALMERLDKEQAFVARYTRRWKPFRVFLFYAG